VAGVEQERGRVGVDVAGEEPAGGEVLEGGGEVDAGGGVDAARGGEAVEDAGAVGVGLEAAEAPEAGVGKGAVVEVHGVLGGDDDADAEGARLLHEGDDGAFGGGIGGVRGEEAVDFVEEEEGAEAVGAGEGADPGEDFFEEDAEDEGALFVVEVGDADDDDGGFVALGTAWRPRNRGAASLPSLG
jgi:hypothetical protein